jgi:hypothetical protein
MPEDCAPISYEILDLFIRSQKKISPSYMLSNLLCFCTVKFGFEIRINCNRNVDSCTLHASSNFISYFVNYLNHTFKT